MPSRTISASVIEEDTLWSGKPRSAVEIAFACTSAPDIASEVEVGWMSCRDVADGPTTTILSRKAPFLNLPVVDGHEGRRFDRPCRPDEVDPRRVAIAELLLGDRLAPRPLGRDEGEARELVHLESHPPDDAAGVEREVPVADTRTDVAHDLVAAEDVRAPALADLRRRQDEVAGLRHGLDEGRVLLDLGLLRELDVVGDDLRAVRVQLVDDRCEVAPRERPANAFAAGIEEAERVVVDRDDGDVLGRRLRPANREANVDAVQLEAAEEVRPEGDQPEAGGCKADAEKQRHLQAASSRAVHDHAL